MLALSWEWTEWSFRWTDNNFMTSILLFFRTTTVTSPVSFIAVTASPLALTNHPSTAPCQLTVCWLWPDQRSAGGASLAAVSAASPWLVTISPTLPPPPRGQVPVVDPGHWRSSAPWITSINWDGRLRNSSSPLSLEDICVFPASLSIVTS